MPQLDRRQLLQSLAGAGALALGPASALAERPDRGRIRAENDREGTLDWQLTYTRVDARAKYRSSMIEGYPSRASLRPGEKLDFFVSTNPPSPFVIDLYRLGYYQGKGGRHVQRLGPFPGRTQPTPPVGEERLRECHWEPCITLEIPRGWVSGVYLGKLSALQHRYQCYVVFIVRDDRPADFVFQCSDEEERGRECFPDQTDWETFPTARPPSPA